MATFLPKRLPAAYIFEMFEENQLFFLNFQSNYSHPSHFYCGKNLKFPVNFNISGAHCTAVQVSKFIKIFLHRVSDEVTNIE